MPIFPVDGCRLETRVRSWRGLAGQEEVEPTLSIAAAKVKLQTAKEVDTE